MIIIYIENENNLNNTKFYNIWTKKKTIIEIDHTLNYRFTPFT